MWVRLIAAIEPRPPRSAVRPAEVKVPSQPAHEETRSIDVGPDGTLGETSETCGLLEFSQLFVQLLQGPTLLHHAVMITASCCVVTHPADGILHKKCVIVVSPRKACPPTVAVIELAIPPARMSGFFPAGSGRRPVPTPRSTAATNSPRAAEDQTRLAVKEGRQAALRWPKTR